MRASIQPAALPLRPLTTGELLDAAVSLLRTRLRGLLLAGFAVALVEQAVLFPLRRLADVGVGYLPVENRWDSFALLLAVGAATEATGIALLGGVASAAAPRALLGPAATAPRRRPVTVVVLALLAGVLCGLAALTGVGWALLFGLLGLTVPVAVIDDRGPVGALRRGVGLAGRMGLRAARIRLLGYGAWFFIRMGIGLGGFALADILIDSPSNTVDNVVAGCAWLAVNTLAYPMLAGLDACLHLESRMRLEGLDIALRRALDRGVATDSALAVPR